MVTPGAYQAVMKLSKEHPSIIPKIAKIYGLMKKGLPMAESALKQIGVSKEEIAILVENGILKKEAIKEDS